jgi:hypothetical protein
LATHAAIVETIETIETIKHPYPATNLRVGTFETVVFVTVTFPPAVGAASK